MNHEIPSHDEVSQLLVPAGTILNGITVEEIHVSLVGSMKSYLRSREPLAFGRGYVEPGTYRAAFKPHAVPGQPPVLWMSDTQDEWNDQLPFLNRTYRQLLIHADEVNISSARYRYPSVLVSGLGLGMTPTALILMKVPAIDIVEIDINVIRLIKPEITKLANEHGVVVRIHHADIKEWKPHAQQRFISAWHDIWPDISDLHLDEMKQLRKRFQGYMLGSTNQFCWAEPDCRRMARMIARIQAGKSPRKVSANA